MLNVLQTETIDYFDIDKSVNTFDPRMQKQTIIIVINDLQKGGAEMLLVGILPELNARYNVVLVTLRDMCDFREEEIVCNKRYNLGVNSRASFVKGLFRLKNIIRVHKPLFVHAHLNYSGLIARMACPANINLIYTLHAVQSNGALGKKGILTYLEKKTFKEYHTIIAVSNEVMIDYERIIGKVINGYVIDNYIWDTFIYEKIPPKKFSLIKKLKLVSVGNIREEKNYIYLLEAFKSLKDYPVTLDIYGKENETLSLLKTLQKEVTSHQLPVVFKGKVDNVYKILPDYDMCVLCSKHEGFGLAVAEAMAVGLPLLLSDLPVLHNVTFNNAIFFDISDPQFFVNRIKEIFDGKYHLNELSAKGMELAKEYYTKTAYLKKLFAVYDKVTVLSNS